MQWVLAATLVCGASVFTSCSSDNDDSPVINPDEPQQQLADYTIIYYGHGGAVVAGTGKRYLGLTAAMTQVPLPHGYLKFFTVFHDYYDSFKISVNGTDITSTLTKEPG